MFSKRNLIFLLIIILSVFLSLVVSVKRTLLESNNNNVEIAIDFQRYENICNYEGQDIFEGFKIFLKSGVNSVLIREDTIQSLARSGAISLVPGSELLKNYRIAGLLNPLLARYIQKKGIQPNFTYIITSDQKLHDRILGELKIKLKDYDQKYSVTSETAQADPGTEAGRDSLFLICVNSSGPDLLNTGVGFNMESVSLLQEIGFSLIMGLSNRGFSSQNQMDRFFEKLQKIEKLSGFLIEDGFVPGYSEQSPNAAEYFSRRLGEFGKMKSKFFVMESEAVTGLPFLTPNIKNIAVKGLRLSAVKSGPPADLAGHNEAVAFFTRAVRERNVKLIVIEGLPAKLSGVSLSLLMQNYNYQKAIVENIMGSGYNIKSSSPCESDLCPPIFIVIISWGALSLYILFFEFTAGMPRKISYLILILFMAFFLIFILKFYGTYEMIYFRQFIALMLTFIIPLAPALNRIRHDKNFQNNADFYNTLYRSGFALLYNLFFVTLFGTLIIGVLSSVEFINGLETFRGSSLSFFMVVAASMALSATFDNLYAKMREFLYSPARTYQVVVLFLATATAFWYLTISGGAGGLDISTIDLAGWFSEKIFGARPPALQFLIGYPALLLYFYLNFRGVTRFNMALAAAGVLGTASLTLSLCAVRVPLYHTFVKAAAGAFLGLVTGAAACAIAEFLINVGGSGPAKAETNTGTEK